MGLADVAAAVMTPVVTALPALTWELSTRAVPQHASPPRVLWIPQAGAYAPPRKDASNPRRLYTWRQSVRILVWAESITAVEELHTLVVRELHRTAHAVMRLGAGQWVDVEGATTLGELYSFAVDFDFAVTEATASTATIDTATADTDTTVAGDGSMDFGEQ
jgi:hypothetical protein